MDYCSKNEEEDIVNSQLLKILSKFKTYCTFYMNVTNKESFMIDNFTKDNNKYHSNYAKKLHMHQTSKNTTKAATNNTINSENKTYELFLNKVKSLLRLMSNIKDSTKSNTHFLLQNVHLFLLHHGQLIDELFLPILIAVEAFTPEAYWELYTLRIYFVQAIYNLYKDYVYELKPHMRLEELIRILPASQAFVLSNIDHFEVQYTYSIPISSSVYNHEKYSEYNNCFPQNATRTASNITIIDSENETLKRTDFSLVRKDSEEKKGISDSKKGVINKERESSVSLNRRSDEKKADTELKKIGVHSRPSFNEEEIFQKMEKKKIEEDTERGSVFNTSKPSPDASNRMKIDILDDLNRSNIPLTEETLDTEEEVSFSNDLIPFFNKNICSNETNIDTYSPINSTSNNFNLDINNKQHEIKFNQCLAMLSTSFVVKNRETFDFFYTILNTINQLQFFIEVYQTRKHGIKRALLTCLFIETLKTCVHTLLYNITPFYIQSTQLHNIQSNTPNNQTYKYTLLDNQSSILFSQKLNNKVKQKINQRLQRTNFTIKRLLKSIYIYFVKMLRKLRSNKVVSIANIMYHLSPFLRLLMFFKKNKTLFWLSWLLPFISEIISLFLLNLISHKHHFTDYEKAEIENRKQELLNHISRPPIVDIFYKFYNKFYSLVPLFNIIDPEYFQRPLLLWQYYYTSP